MSRLDVAVRGLFATPVAAVMLPDPMARNRELSEIILKRRADTQSIQASNAGGWHSDRDIAEWGGPRIAEVLDLGRQVANQLTADRSGQRLSPKWAMQAWANVNGPSDGNISHYHPGSFWSGTYYVDDGGCGLDPALGGEFEMLDPRGPAPGMYAPALQFALAEGASAGAAETIRPKPGLLFVFPSWLLHQVRPYRGRALRISIAFNLGLPARRMEESA